MYGFLDTGVIGKVAMFGSRVVGKYRRVLVRSGLHLAGNVKATATVITRAIGKNEWNILIRGSELRLELRLNMKLVTPVARNAKSC